MTIPRQCSDVAGKVCNWFMPLQTRTLIIHVLIVVVSRARHMIVVIIVVTGRTRSGKELVCV